MKYRKNPVVIEAFRLGIDRNPIWFNEAMSAGAIKDYPHHGFCIIATLEGELIAKRGDYIIQGVKGELYPCKPDIFEATYEVVNETN